MSTEIISCPNCGTKLKGQFLTNHTLLSKNKIAIINEYHTPKHDAYCSKCGDELYARYKAKLLSERADITRKLFSLLEAMPIITTHSPLHWDYEIISIVTGQSTTGTGALSELTSSFTDFFGVQSERYNKKLKAGENMCFAQLRKQTMNLGGNAIIATDIDYTEVGGEKGMLMVCVSGTAIRLKNSENSRSGANKAA